jgi:hypothetical protein
MFASIKKNSNNTNKATFSLIMKNKTIKRTVNKSKNVIDFDNNKENSKNYFDNGNQFTLKTKFSQKFDDKEK